MPDLRLTAPALTAWACAALTVGLAEGWRLAVAVLAGLVGTAAVWRGARRPRRRHRPRWQTATPTLALGALLAMLATASVSVQDAQRTSGLGPALGWSGTTAVTVRITSSARPLASGAPRDGGRVRLEGVLTQTGVRGVHTQTQAPVVVIGPTSWADLVPGTTVSAAAHLRALPRGERPVAILQAQDPTTVAGAPWWQQSAHTVRATLVAGTAGLPPHAGLLPGIGVGQDTQVPPALADAMRQVSLGHLLAVSGAHVAIVLTGVLAASAGLRPGVRASFCLTVLAGLVILVGPDPSVIRAAAMGSVVVLALLLGRGAAALPALAGAVVVLVLADPWIAREAGFALSVCATAGLILGAGPLSDLLVRKRCPPLLAPAIAIPLAAQLACLPVLVLLDPAIATYGVLANALVAPVIPPLTVLVLTAAVLGPVWPGGAHALLWVAQAGSWWIQEVARVCAGLPLARLPWPAGWAGLVLLLATAMLLVALAVTTPGRQLRERWRGRGSWLVITVGALLAVVGLAGSLVAPWRGTLVDVAAPMVAAEFPPSTWRVLQCDVGQGSALLLSSAAAGGGERAVMVDVGPEQGDAAGCLAQAGVRHLDLLVLTHADADHVGALAPVLAAVEVEKVLVPETSDPRMAEVVVQVRAAGVDVAQVSAESAATQGPIDVGRLRLSVLWPTSRAVEIGQEVDPNELSLTLWVSAPNLTLLVHGDLGAAAQVALTRATPALLTHPPDVVVVSHHGSPDQDPALLEAAAGRVALISVGQDNDYGHPAPAVVDTLTSAGALVARTDRCGSIALMSAADGTLSVAGCEQ